MPTLQIRNLPDHLYKKIVDRAKAKRSSITREAINLLQTALETDVNRCEQRNLLVDRLLENPVPRGESFPDPVQLIREERDR